MTVYLLFIYSLMLSILLLATTNISSKISESNQNNWSTFECGFSTQVPSHNSFSIQFFLVMILFLIFDIEISLLFPFPISQLTQTNQNITITLLILVLLIGLLAEWTTNNLSWNN